MPAYVIMRHLNLQIHIIKDTFAPVLEFSMRRLIMIVVAALSFAHFSPARDVKAVHMGNDAFSVKAQAFMGTYLDPSGNIVDIDPNAPTGLNFGVEFPSSRQRPWQQYLNDPTVGLGLTYMNLGNDVMGEGLAIYPYIMLNVLRVPHFHAKIKLASGLAALNGHYKATVNEEIPNETFGSMFNVFLSGGLNLDFPINRNLTINAEVGYNHMSNGRISEPNKGANILYGGVGLIATVNPTEDEARVPKRFPSLPYKWSLNITGAAGAQNADMTDAGKFLISTFHVGGIYNVTNWYGVGLGMDVFFNDAIGNVTNRGLFCRKHEYSNADKTRMGISLNNELQFGDVTAMVDWGLYLINPARNFYNFDHERTGCDSKIPLFYKTDGAGSQEACHYIRFGVKYRVWDNIYLQALAKTHRHIAECIEFGVGYQIPFLRKSARRDDSVVFHHRRGWWENYD